MATRKRIAVVYATGQGTTKEIAEFLGLELEARGAEVAVAPAGSVPDLTDFDTVVLGSAVYHGALLPPAVVFAHRRHDQLAEREVWLFSVGLVPALRGPIGRRLADAVPKQIAMVRDAVRARDYHAFAGRYERAGLPLQTRLRYLVKGGLCYGDLRDWDDIRAWASRIADAPAKRVDSETNR